MAITSTAMPTSSVASEREHGADDEASGQGREGGGEIGADHVERAVRQVDQVHDAEDQRQPGRKQEQQQPELQTVQALFDETAAWNSAPPRTPSRQTQPPYPPSSRARGREGV